MADYLLPIADREPLAWIVSEQRTAVGARGRREAEKFQRGDRIFSTQPAGASGIRRVIGAGVLASRTSREARTLDEPVRFGEREYPIDIALRIESLAPQGTGVELVPLLDRLESFPNRRAWSASLRRALVPVTPRDGELIARALERVVRGYGEAVATYTS